MLYSDCSCFFGNWTLSVAKQKEEEFKFLHPDYFRVKEIQQFDEEELQRLQAKESQMKFILKKCGMDVPLVFLTEIEPSQDIYSQEDSFSELEINPSKIIKNKDLYPRNHNNKIYTPTSVEPFVNTKLNRFWKNSTESMNPFNCKANNTFYSKQRESTSTTNCGRYVRFPKQLSFIITFLSLNFIR
jgi:hypothetical protein